MAEKFTRWEAADHLKTEADIKAYFEACLDDDPGDGRLVRAALGVSPRLAICRGWPKIKDCCCQGPKGVGKSQFVQIVKERLWD